MDKQTAHLAQPQGKMVQSKALGKYLTAGADSVPGSHLQRQHTLPVPGNQGTKQEYHQLALSQSPTARAVSVPGSHLQWKRTLPSPRTSAASGTGFSPPRCKNSSGCCCCCCC
eukprot:752704-Pelagomonas_calceolata.AAC.1